MWFIKQFIPKIWPIQLAFLVFIVFRIFLSSFILSNIPSFLKWSVQLIFSILLQHYISKLSRYLWITFRSAQVSAPYKLCFKSSTLLVSSLNLSPICRWKEKPNLILLKLLQQVIFYTPLMLLEKILLCVYNIIKFVSVLYH
jgi:hypothetical protein